MEIANFCGEVDKHFPHFAAKKKIILSASQKYVYGHENGGKLSTV